MNELLKFIFDHGIITVCECKRIFIQNNKVYIYTLLLIRPVILLCEYDFDYAKA